MDYHQERMDRSCLELWGEKAMSLTEILSGQKIPVDGPYKCRLLYDQVSRKVEFIPYQMKSIRSLKWWMDKIWIIS